jgi:hypothetical protein
MMDSIFLFGKVDAGSRRCSLEHLIFHVAINYDEFGQGVILVSVQRGFF